MVDIVKALNQKTEPLAKKADNLGVPKPTQPNLAASLGATDKSAQMAPTPQAQMASQKQTSEQQKSQRSAKIQAEAPRDIAGAADLNSKAAAIIGSIGDTITAERVQGAVDTSAGPAGGEMSQEQGFDLAQSGTGLAGPDAKNIEFADVGETFNVPVSEVLSPEELSEVTGLFGPEAAGMTIDQLQARVEEEANELTAQVDDNREILNDPNQPPDVRQVARQNMIDLGAAHLIATDAELDAFEQDLSKADAIQIQGQTYSLQDLEDNEKVMAEAYNIATQLLENPDLSAEEFNTSESFFNFIQNHANAIQSVFDKNKKMYEEEILPKVDANKAMIGWTDGMDAETLKAIGLEGFGVYQDNDFDKMPGLKALADSETGQTDITLVKDMAKLNPELAKQFLSSGDPNLLTEMKNRKTALQVVNTMDSTESAIPFLMGVDFGQAADLVREAAELNRQFGEPMPPALSILDGDGDGNIDDWQSIQERLKQHAIDGGGSLDASSMQTEAQATEAKIKELRGEWSTDVMSLGDVNNIIKNFKKEGLPVPDDITAKRKELVGVKKKPTFVDAVDLGGNKGKEFTEPNWATLETSSKQRAKFAKSEAEKKKQEQSQGLGYINENL